MKKKKVSLRVTESMVKHLFCHFWVTNSNLINIKLHFELVTQSRLILKIQFYLCPVPLEGYQENISLFSWLPIKSNYLYIIISYCSQRLFSKLNVLVKPGTQNYFLYSCVESIGYQTSWWLAFYISFSRKNCLPNQFQTWKCQRRNNDK